MTSRPEREYPRTAEDRFAQMEAARRELIATALELDAAKAATRPHPDRWSPAEVLYHLHQAEGRITRALTAALSTGERHEPKSDDDLRAEWDRVSGVLRDREVKFSAPAPLNPEGAPPVDESVRLLGESRGALLELLRVHQPADLASVSMPHPATAIGMVSVLGWLTIVAGHDDRHREQILESV